ncbi:winged helix-turn-helix transcriptional regulator [Stutzerimonas stutzeri]|uniref:winged helix-turn-helix transcriptional regulator n=1 Tax=Stutzerimonas stutzeri TaxID=316 RepID=UPI00210B2742|nr:helix-turn-helix domain-containing protein [Stutzerimonas stutzeri]MCQ4262168.1 helix-turn-helix transcriptional regulator [Stutzerimonas stutzeri]
MLEIFSTKWTSMILHTLQARHNGVARSGVLHRSLPGISKKMLIQTLRELEASGLIERHQLDSVPPEVSYALSPLGRLMVQPIEMVYEWARQNSPALDQLQPRATSRRRD